MSHYHMFPPWVQTLQEVAGVLILAVFGYMAVAMFFGCPYCPCPDMAWPYTLLKKLSRRVSG